MKTDCTDPAIRFCPVETGIELLSGKWKARILWKLHNREVMRFGELRRELGRITEKMLAQQLRELENARMIVRTEHREVPPRVDYRLSDFGQTICPILESFAEWGVAQKETIARIVESPERRKYAVG
jgi:DNA-binding HxlR family transcriptional regulator